MQRLKRALNRTDAAASVGMVGVPMCAIFDYAMGTPSGHAAFLDPDVNRMLKKILNKWGEYLKVCPLFPSAQSSDCAMCY
jgi:phosphatidylserine decarboxylase